MILTLVFDHLAIRTSETLIILELWLRDTTFLDHINLGVLERTSINLSYVAELPNAGSNLNQRLNVKD